MRSGFIGKIFKNEILMFIISLSSTFVMGIIHLVATIIQFKWSVLNYCIFAFMIFIIKIIMYMIDKGKIRINRYIFGMISVGFLIIPMMVSFILTILFEQAPNYIFPWLIYVYALIGTLKMFFAIRNLTNKKKEKNKALAWIGVISSLYTIQMLEFRLIMFFENGKVESKMFNMQLFTQGAIFIFAIVVMVIFITNYRKEKHNKGFEIKEEKV